MLKSNKLTNLVSFLNDDGNVPLNLLLLRYLNC